MSVSLRVNIWLSVLKYMYLVYHGVSMCMYMRESLASSCGFMPRSPSRCPACSFVSAELAGWLVALIFNVPVNNFSVMLGRSQHFLGITSTFGE